MSHCTSRRSVIAFDYVNSSSRFNSYRGARNRRCPRPRPDIDGTRWRGQCQEFQPFHADAGNVPACCPGPDRDRLSVFGQVTTSQAPTSPGFRPVPSQSQHFNPKLDIGRDSSSSCTCEIMPFLSCFCRQQLVRWKALKTGGCPHI